MNLTPLDIRKKEFKKVMRGLDPSEVETFLEDVSDFVIDLLEENKALKLKVEHLGDEAKVLKEITERPQQEERNEQDFAEREAKMIIRESELKAMEILERAKADHNRIKEEVIILKTQKATFLKRLKQIISSQVEMLDVLELDDLDDEMIETSRVELQKAPIKKTIVQKEFKIDPKEILNRVQNKTNDELNIDLNVVKNKNLKPMDDLPFIRKKKPKVDPPKSVEVTQESLFSDIEVVKKETPEPEKIDVEEKKQDLHKALFNNDKIDDDFERMLDELGN